MAVSILIIVLSLALLVYWLRYTCLLLLSEATTATDTSFSLFSFHRIRRQLAAGGSMHGLHKNLDRDYRVLTYLGSKTGALSAVDAQLLVWDYRLMRCWHAVTRTAFPVQSRKALEEMADVLAILASKLRGASQVA
jgi:hypothetical protein